MVGLKSLRLAICSVAIALTPMMHAEVTLTYHGEIIANTGSGSYAPYYIASNRHGIITQQSDALARIGISKSLDTDSGRFSYGFAIDALSGYSSSTHYQRYNTDGSIGLNCQRPATIWLQQFYAAIRYSRIFLSIGARESGSALLNDVLSSGDMTESANARPIPQIRAGFIDFVDVPFTSGWLQINGVIAYGKFTDGTWLENHTYRHEKITTNEIYHYKRLYFRIAGHKPLSLTIGMQTAAQMNGTIQQWSKGSFSTVTTQSTHIKDIWLMFFPEHNRITYYPGNSLGNWDMHLTYRIASGRHILHAYWQKPWEDGSGIGFQNGLDGLWGLEYTAPSEFGWISGAVAEFIDLTNQSGPIHCDPILTPEYGITTHTSGGDDYYNNGGYNGWSNYGMSIGSAMVPSPLYNGSGQMSFLNNRIKGFHIGINGHIGRNFDWRCLGSRRRGWGRYAAPINPSQYDTSLLIEATWHPHTIAGLQLTLQGALDRGTIYGNNCGALISARYTGNFTIRK